MKVLVTGSKGFIGKNLTWWLTNTGHEVIEFDMGQTLESLLPELEGLDFVVHLAGVNRPTDPYEYYEGNYIFTQTVVDFLLNNWYRVPIIYASSSQATLDNDYGKSKKMAEEYLQSSSLVSYIYRLDNVFGPGVRPNYNSFVSTMANAIANGLDYKLDDPTKVITLVNVFDICNEFENIISGRYNKNENEIHTIPGKKISLGTVEGFLKLFHKHPFQFPVVKDSFVANLYLAYLSYRPDAVKELVEHRDERGCFIELVKNPEFGQISINLSKPGVTKGNHYHTRKIEDFMTIFGTCVTKLRKVGGTAIKEFNSDGTEPTTVHIKPPYVHSIINVGPTISLTLMWINEIYDPNDGDTFVENVEKSI